MFRINNKDTITNFNGVFICAKLWKPKHFPNAILKKVGNVVLSSGCLSRTKKQQKYLKTFANNHIWKQNAWFFFLKKLTVTATKSDKSKIFFRVKGFKLFIYFLTWNEPKRKFKGSSTQAMTCTLFDRKFLIIRRNLKETASFMELQKKDKKSECYSSNNSLGFVFNSEVVKPFNAYINFIQ